VTLAVTAIGTLIEAAVGALGVLLDAAIGLVEDAVDALASLISDTIDAIVAIAAAIWTAFIAVVGDLFDAIIAILDTIFQGIIDAGQIIVDAIFAALLSVLNLTSIFNEFSLLVSFVIAIIFYLFAAGVFALFSGALLVSKDPEEALSNFWAIASFDMMFGQSFLGIRIYLPFGFFMLIWIVIFGFADDIIFATPWN